MAGLLVMMPAMKILLRVTCATSLACSCAGMAVLVLRGSTVVMYTLSAQTAPMRLTVSAVVVHKRVLSDAQDSQTIVPSLVTERLLVRTIGTSCSPLVRLTTCLALRRPASISARTAPCVLQRGGCVTLSKNALMERMKHLGCVKTNVSQRAQWAILSTGVMAAVVYTVDYFAAHEMKMFLCATTALI